MAFYITYRYLLRTVFIFAALWSLVSSCSSSADEEMTADSREVPIVEIKIAPMRMEAASGTTSSDGSATTEYEDGTGDENYISLEKNRLRIYFFDKDNAYIGRFYITAISSDADGSGGVSLTGLTPSALSNYTDFKVVVYANVNGSDCEKLETGTPSYETLVYNGPKYDVAVNSGLDHTKDRLMPFFGVHVYNNVTLVKGELTQLEAPVKLIRAMAKIEVEFDNTSADGTTLSTMDQLEGISLCGCNPHGYVAPYMVGDDDTYLDANGRYSLADDYINLPGTNRTNETNAENNIVMLQRVTKATATKNEKWVGYVSEYENVNVSDEDKHAYLKVKFAFQPGYEAFRIDFANYGTDGKPTSSSKSDGTSSVDYLNIRRNYIYRFKVTVVENNKMAVTVNAWKNAFDNSFEFQ